MQSNLSALISHDVYAMIKYFASSSRPTNTDTNILHVIDIKCTMWSMLELIGSGIVFNRQWAGVCLQSDWLYRRLLFTHLLLRLCILHLCFSFSFVHLNSLSAAVMSALISLLLCASYCVFVANSVFHHWSMFYQRFILTIEQLPECFFFSVNSGPLRFTGC